MRRPQGLRWIVGQSVVTVPVVIAGIACLYLWYSDAQAWPLGIAAIAIMIGVLKANQEVAEYRAWQREWEAMGGAAPAPARSGATWKRTAGAAFVVLIVVYYAEADPSQPGYAAGLTALVLAGAVGAVALIVRLVRRHRSSAARQPRAAAEPVAICVRRPLMKVPDLQGAYAALPEHCWKALNSGRG